MGASLRRRLSKEGAKVVAHDLHLRRNVPAVLTADRTDSVAFDVARSGCNRRDDLIINSIGYWPADADLATVPRYTSPGHSPEDCASNRQQGKI